MPLLEIPFTTLNDSGNYLFRNDKLHVLTFLVSNTQIRGRCATCKNQITVSVNNKSQERADN